MNNLRPVALTSSVMTVFEKVIMPHINKIVYNFLDPTNINMHKKQKEAILDILNNIYAH